MVRYSKLVEEYVERVVGDRTPYLHKSSSGELAEWEIRFVDKVKEERTEQATILMPTLVEALEVLHMVSSETTLGHKPCDGSHTQYSSMWNDKLCEKCREPEDGPGGVISYKVRTQSGEAAHKLLTNLIKTLEGRHESRN